MNIIDNFLPEETFQQISSYMLSATFPWYYACSVLENADCEEQFNYQFGHNFYGQYAFQSEYGQLILPLIQKLNLSAIHRIKGLLLPRTEKHIEHGMHVDNSYNTTNALFYINTNNGYTKFEDGTKVDSIANRMLIFPSGIKHTGSTCTDVKVRVAINFNYF